MPSPQYEAKGSVCWVLISRASAAEYVLLRTCHDCIHESFWYDMLGQASDIFLNPRLMPSAKRYSTQKDAVLNGFSVFQADETL